MDSPVLPMQTPMLAPFPMTFAPQPPSTSPAPYLPAAYVPPGFSLVPERGNRANDARWVLDSDDVALLERVFDLERCPGRDLRQELSSHLGVTTRQVQVWFQNKRQRTKVGPKTTVAETEMHSAQLLMQIGSPSMTAKRAAGSDISESSAYQSEEAGEAKRARLEEEDPSESFAPCSPARSSTSVAPEVLAAAIASLSSKPPAPTAPAASAAAVPDSTTSAANILATANVLANARAAVGGPARPMPVDVVAQPAAATLAAPSVQFATMHTLATASLAMQPMLAPATDIPLHTTATIMNGSLQLPPASTDMTQTEMATTAARQQSMLFAMTAPAGALSKPTVLQPVIAQGPSVAPPGMAPVMTAVATMPSIPITAHTMGSHIPGAFTHWGQPKPPACTTNGSAAMLVPSMQAATSDGYFDGRTLWLRQDLLTQHPDLISPANMPLLIPHQQTLVSVVQGTKRQSLPPPHGDVRWATPRQL